LKVLKKMLDYINLSTTYEKCESIIKSNGAEILKFKNEKLLISAKSNLDYI